MGSLAIVGKFCRVSNGETRFDRSETALALLLNVDYRLIDIFSLLVRSPEATNICPLSLLSVRLSTHRADFSLFVGVWRRSWR